MQSVQKIELLEGWKIKNPARKIEMPTKIPSSVFEELINEKIIQDPFFGLEEHNLNWVYESDWIYECEFDLPVQFLAHTDILLRCYGLDTFTTILLNDQPIGTTENMHRTYDFYVKSPDQALLKEKGNRLRINFQSATKKAREEIETHHHQLDTGRVAIPGVPYIRKAQYAFGWDWGPQLPDIGIWRKIELVAFENIKIGGIQTLPTFTYQAQTITQVQLETIINVEINSNEHVDPNTQIEVVITDPKNQTQRQTATVTTDFTPVKFQIQNPSLWWIYELGSPALYKITAILKVGTKVIDQFDQWIGIRDLKLIRKADKWGETFYFQLNGVPIFAKGGDWVPIDSFIPRGKKLGLYQRNLDAVKQANMNMLRVWGGGIYEDDEFYTRCDQMGILTWQDFLFACAPNPADPDFFENVKIEATQNVQRLRHHPSLAIWVGNNENEEGWVHWGWSLKHPKELKQAYLDMFEKLLPNVVKESDPTRPYWPSSPSSGGNFREPRSQDRGDAHFWQVWGGGAPFSDYHDNYSRFMSEFGFQSFPSMKTINAYCPPDQQRFNSPIMENHQKCWKGNQKIMNYMKNRYSIPKTFEKQVIVSQITHAEAMEYGVEHWRRNRNDFHCMGALYWQINDCWPVASWASLDYFGRWKALHYFAKRFYSPRYVSMVEKKEGFELWITNDLLEPAQGTLNWKLMNASGECLLQNQRKIDVAPGSSQLIEAKDLARLNKGRKRRQNIVFYWFLDDQNNLISKGSRVFETPKAFPLKDPHLQVEITENASMKDGKHFQIELQTQEIALYIYLESDQLDFVTSDNYFSLNKGEHYMVQLEINTTITSDQLHQALKIGSLFHLLKK